MKKIFNIIMILSTLSLLVLTACGSAPSSESNSLTVLASTSFLADIAQNVAGDRVQVQSLLPLGTNTHAYQATLSDVTKIAESDLLILNGLKYEHFIKSVLENADGERIIVEATSGITLHEEKSSNDIADYICNQISDKSYDIKAGIDAELAILLKGDEEHSHERDIFNVRLNPQADGSYAGFLFFDANAKEEEYVFTYPEGNIAVYSLGNIALVAQEEFDIDCSNMSHAISYNLYVGRYIVELSGFNKEEIQFSATANHFGEEENADKTESTENHKHEAGDPHLWLNPNLVIRYAENIRDGFIQVDPAGKDIYEKNAQAYISQLKDLDAWIVEQVNQIPAERKLLVTNHEALNYFAEQYGFEVVDSILPSFSSEASASAQEIASAIDAIKNSGAPAIFLGEVENADLANQIASETNVKVVDNLYLESLTDGEPAGTYIDMMKHNVMQIVNALAIYD